MRLITLIEGTGVVLVAGSIAVGGMLYGYNVGHKYGVDETQLDLQVEKLTVDKYGTDIFYAGIHTGKIIDSGLLTQNEVDIACQNQEINICLDTLRDILVVPKSTPEPEGNSQHTL